MRKTLLVLAAIIAMAAAAAAAHAYTAVTWPTLMMTSWCVRDHRSQTPAEYVYNGNSLCKRHFLLLRAKAGPLP